MIKKTLFAFICASILMQASLPAFATSSDKHEQALIWSLVTGNVLDVVQTSTFHDRGLGEANPLFQDAVRSNNMASVILTKTAVIAVSLLFLQALPQNERIQALSTANAIQWGVVVWNEFHGGGFVFRVPLAN